VNNFAKGAEYSKKAMRKAEKSASLSDAIAHARKRVACIEKLPQTDEIQRMRIDARTMLGLYIAQLNYLAEAKEAIDPIIELAKKTNYKKRLCQILTILGTHYHYVEEDVPQSCKAFEESLKIADEIQDIVTLAMGSFWFGFPLSFDCQFERAATYFQKGIDINAFVNNLWGVAAMTSNLAVWCHFFSGKIEQCMKASGEAVTIAEKSGDIFSKGMAYTSYGNAHFGKGFFDDAEKHFLLGLKQFPDLAQ
jgi:tetratricopeptide (TPR) repeat protein